MEVGKAREIRYFANVLNLVVILLAGSLITSGASPEIGWWIVFGCVGFSARAGLEGCLRKK